MINASFGVRWPGSALALIHQLDLQCSEFFRGLADLAAAKAAQGCRTPKRFYSALSAGINGERKAAAVATNEAISPDSKTMNNNNPREMLGSRPPRPKKTGATASSAQMVPVRRPQKSRKQFSAITINVKCEEL
jgi:hypothetical protein